MLRRSFLTGITSTGLSLGRRPIARAQEPQSLRLSIDVAAAGGAINTGDTASPYTADFNKLHHRSETVEMIVMLLGVGTVVTVAYAESARA